MWRLVFVAAVSGSLLAAACGGSSDKKSPAAGTSSPGSTATAKPSTDDKDLRSHEADLRETAIAFQKGIFADGTAKTYGYFADDFKERCSLDEFIALMAIAKIFLGDIEESDIEVSISDVRYEDGKAFVTSTGTIKGDPVDEGDDEFPEYWVREDGEWKFATDDPKPCDTDNSSSGSSSSGSKTPVSGPGTSRAEAVSIGTAVQAGDAEFTVISVNLDAATAVAGSSSFPSTPAAGNRYVLARVRVKAVGSGEETVDIGTSNFSMTGSGNKVYEPYDENASCGFDVPDELDAKLFPGGVAEGNVCIQIPRSERDLILIAAPQFSFNDGDSRYLALE